MSDFMLASGRSCLPLPILVFTLFADLTPRQSTQPPSLSSDIAPVWDFANFLQWASSTFLHSHRALLFLKALLRMNDDEFGCLSSALVDSIGTCPSLGPFLHLCKLAQYVVYCRKSQNISQENENHRFSPRLNKCLHQCCSEQVTTQTSGKD